MGANQCHKGCYRLSLVHDKVSIYKTNDYIILGKLGRFNVIFLTCIFSCCFSVKIDPSEGFLKSGQDPLLTVYSAGHSLHVFINGQLSGGLNGVLLVVKFLLDFLYSVVLTQQFILIAGTVYGSLNSPKLTFSQNVKLNAGVNKISLLSVAVGLQVSFHFCDVSANSYCRKL